MDFLDTSHLFKPEFSSRSLPERDKVAYCLEALWFLLFPMHLRSNRYFLAGASLSCLDQIQELCKKELEIQIQKGFFACQIDFLQTQELTRSFFETLPDLREKLVLDAKAAFKKDPAASNIDEVILSYPGFLALVTHRLAHALARLKVPLIPRMMSEYVHSLTGCDIHPNAQIGDSFFIDHATGVVIGQTSVIGNRVTIYQGVTLGSLSVKSREMSQKRHPTIEDDVVVYANATILGGNTVIGARSVIGGSCWITFSIPPDSRVILAKPQTVTTHPQAVIEYVPNWDI